MEAFYESWLGWQHQLLQELLSARSGNPECDEDRLLELVNRSLAHYKAYYREKARLADRDVLLVYSPAWLTPYERTFLWIAGFRPSLVFRLLRATAEEAERPPEQALAIAELQTETAEEERRLTREMERVQEVMTRPQVVAMVRRSAAAVDGENRAQEDEVLEPVMRSLRLLLERADGLRVRLVKRLVEILRPAQMVDLLAAAGQLHVSIRGWGMLGREATGRTAA